MKFTMNKNITYEYACQIFLDFEKKEAEVKQYDKK